MQSRQHAEASCYVFLHVHGAKGLAYTEFVLDMGVMQHDQLHCG